MEVVVTTGLRVSQGGAQDINFFRGEVAFARIPHPNTLTAEGLMSEHDIVFAGDRQLPPVVLSHGRSQSRGSDRRAAERAISLAWASPPTSIEKKWRRARLNLIAVVDKSGSMDGEPLELVRQSLTSPGQPVAARRPDDHRVVRRQRTRAPAHDGSHPLWRSDHPRVHHRIRSEGSTSMEAGLTLGYEIAETTAPAFKGVTRLMLFTDERPNTDATDAESFMGMADKRFARWHRPHHHRRRRAVRRRARHADQQRAGRQSLLHPRPADVKTLFTGQLDYMVSELAYDLKLTITPRAGLKIGGVYGIPGELLGWQNETSITVTIPTVFLDNHGGGIFFTLMPEPGSEFLPEDRWRRQARRRLGHLSTQGHDARRVTRHLDCHAQRWAERRHGARSPADRRVHGAARRHQCALPA